MAFSGLNWIAILMAAAAGFGFGAIWYGIFGNAWMQAADISEEDMKGDDGSDQSSALPFMLAVIANLIMARTLAGIRGHMIVDIEHGLITAALIWLGFVVTTMMVNYSFQMRPFTLTVIDGGHWLCVLLLMGVIIGWMGTAS